METAPDAPTGSLYRWPLWCILAVALAIRLFWGVTRPTDPATLAALPDQREYFDAAQSLRHHGTLCFVDPRFNQTVYAFRMPGYPLLIAACGGNLRTVRVVQAGLDTLTVLVGAMLAAAIFGPGAGWATGGLLAVNPYLVFFSALLLSDTLFTALLSLSLLLLVQHRWMVAAAMLAVSILVRPVGLPLALLLPAAAVFLQTRRWRSAVSALAVSTVLVLGALTPWAIRNVYVVHGPVLLTTNSGFTLYDGFNDHATGGSDQSFTTRIPSLQGMNEVERSRYLSKQAVDWIFSHPGRCIALAGRKFDRLWSPIPLSAEFGRASTRFISLAYSLPVDLAILVGMAIRRWRTGASVLWSTLVLVTLTHVASVGSIRYRVPVEPPLACLACGLLARGKVHPDLDTSWVIVRAIRRPFFFIASARSPAIASRKRE